MAGDGSVDYAAMKKLIDFHIEQGSDAIVSVAIGGLLILTGLAMLAGGGGGMQTIINVLCGSMFLTAATRSWRDHRLCLASSYDAVGLTTRAPRATV